HLRLRVQGLRTHLRRVAVVLRAAADEVPGVQEEQARTPLRRGRGGHLQGVRVLRGGLPPCRVTQQRGRQGRRRLYSEDRNCCRDEVRSEGRGTRGTGREFALQRQTRWQGWGEEEGVTGQYTRVQPRRGTRVGWIARRIPEVRGGANR